MSPREATRYLLWAGEKAEAGDELTPDEMQRFRAARAVSVYMAEKFLRLKPEDWKYEKGVPYK